MPKKITVVHNFGGRRHPPPALPPSVRTWGMWDCDPTVSNRPPTQRHAYGKTFPWKFDMEEKAYVLEGSATLTADDPVKNGPPVTIVPGDMVTFPKNWSGVWEVHSFLRKVYAFFDKEGLRVDEEEDNDEEAEDKGRYDMHMGVGRGTGGRLRKKRKVDYSMFDTLTLRKDSAAWHEVLRSSNIPPFVPRCFEGKDVSGSMLQKTGFKVPFLVPNKEGLGIEIPDGLTVAGVVERVGHDYKIPVLDVGTQQGRTMTLGEWGAHWALGDEETRRKANGQLNVISLEVSHTELGKSIRTPRPVREVDWIDTVWKARGNGAEVDYPKVQLYCLMGTKGSYTDFHIDFGGTSVWYHIVSGEKWFYLIPPTEENLHAYESWTSSASQNAVFFPDMLAPGSCKLLKFGTGNTLFIPSGWIHAVYTPRDTLVFGGNFLHSMGASMQLRVHDIEMATKVPQKYLFPRYKLLYRYFISQMLSRLREELFGWKDLASIEGYHSIFGSAYSHDKQTLLTRLRGAELEAQEGPGMNEDFDRFIFLRKCLWRQQIRVRRARRLESEQNAERKRMKEQQQLERPQGPHGSSGDKSTAISDSHDKRTGIDKNTNLPGTMRTDAVTDLNVNVLVKQEPDIEKSEVRNDTLLENNTGLSVADSNLSRIDGDNTKHEQPLSEIVKVEILFSPHSLPEKQGNVTYLPGLEMSVMHYAATVFDGDGGAPNRRFDVVVCNVIEGGPASKAGISVGDILLEIDTPLPTCRAYGEGAAGATTVSESSISTCKGKDWLATHKLYWEKLRKNEKKVANSGSSVRSDTLQMDSFSDAFNNESIKINDVQGNASVPNTSALGELDSKNKNQEPIRMKSIVSARTICERLAQTPHICQVLLRRNTGCTVSEAQEWLSSRKARWQRFRDRDKKRIQDILFRDLTPFEVQLEKEHAFLEKMHGWRYDIQSPSIEICPDKLLSIYDLKTLADVVKQLENWPRSQVSEEDLHAVSELLRERLGSLGALNETDIAGSSSSSSNNDSRARKKTRQFIYWAQCESCEKWRILSEELGEFESFRCADKGRSCSEPEDEEPDNLGDGSSSGSGNKEENAMLKHNHNSGLGVPIYVTFVENETPASIANLLGISASDLVRRNNAASGGALKGLFKSSKLFKGTTLILPASAVSSGSETGYREGAMYITARDGETPKTICTLLGLEDVMSLVRLNKTRLKGLNSKSKLKEGTEVLLPEKKPGIGPRTMQGKSMRFMKFESGVGKG